MSKEDLLFAMFQFQNGSIHRVGTFDNSTRFLRFNSKMVRLIAVHISLVKTMISGFNSKMVRLIDISNMGHPCVISFQFQNGSINSIFYAMARLIPRGFQFQNGSINRGMNEGFDTITAEFQFQNGSINRG